jgi:hypothetical protein
MQERKADKRKVRAAFNRLFDPTGNHPDLMDKLVYAIAMKAMDGDVSAFKEMADRLEGKVPQSIGQDDELGPIGVIVTGVPRAEDDE